jgi:hypothetical protein
MPPAAARLGDRDARARPGVPSTPAGTVIHFSTTSGLSIGAGLDVVEDLPGALHAELLQERRLGGRVRDLLRRRFEGGLMIRIPRSLGVNSATARTGLAFEM